MEKPKASFPLTAGILLFLICTEIIGITGLALRNLGFVRLLKNPSGSSIAQRAFEMALNVTAGLDRQSLLGLSIVHLRQGDYSLALTLVSRAYGLDGNDPLLFYWQGEALIKAGEIERGVEAWRRTGDLGYWRLLLTEAERHVYDWGNAKITRLFVERLVQVDPSSRRAHTILAWTHLQLGEYPQAAAEGKRAIELGDNSNEQFEIVGRASRALGVTDDAIYFLEQSIARNPGVLYPYVELGYAYLTKGRKDLAAEQFRKALEIAPGLPDAVQGLRQATENP